MHRLGLGSILALLLIGAAGCGSSQGTVHGVVTGNGQNVEEGFISFMPLDDQNGTYGAPIQNGKYTARVNPGKYRVVVTGGRKGAPFPKSQEEMKNVADRELARADQAPASAQGNCQEIEIKKGGQQLNIALEYSNARR